MEEGKQAIIFFGAILLFSFIGSMIANQFSGMHRIVNETVCTETETITSLGLPDQMKEQGIAWARNIPIGETRKLDCFLLKKETSKLITITDEC